MEPQINRDVRTADVDHDGRFDTPIATPVTEAAGYSRVVDAPVVDAPVATGPAVYALERTESWRTVAPHAVGAGMLAVAMLVWGGVALARAGFDSPWRDPVVDVMGTPGNAVSGLIVAGIGIVLLLAALARDRGPVVFVTVVAGVAALIVAIEPGAGDDALGVSSTLPGLIAAGCAVVLALALIVPTVNRRVQTVDRL